MKTSLLPFSSQLQINHPLGRKLLILCHLSAVMIPLFIWNLWTSIPFISLIKAQMHRPTNIRHLSTHQHRLPSYINLLYAVEKTTRIEIHGGDTRVSMKCPPYHHLLPLQLLLESTAPTPYLHLIYLWNMLCILHRFEVLLASLSQAYQMSYCKTSIRGCPCIQTIHDLFK